MCQVKLKAGRKPKMTAAQAGAAAALNDLERLAAAAAATDPEVERLYAAAEAEQDVLRRAEKKEVARTLHRHKRALLDKVRYVTTYSLCPIFRLLGTP